MHLEPRSSEAAGAPSPHRFQDETNGIMMPMGVPEGRMQGHRAHVAKKTQTPAVTASQSWLGWHFPLLWFKERIPLEVTNSQNR